MRSEAGELLSKMQAGFLGPIGDDLPSLIPLVFALIIFFTVFTQTFNTFDERNTLFRDALSVVRLSDIFVGNSYIIADSQGSKQFDQMCLTAQSIRTLNWKAGIVPLDVTILERKTREKFFQGIDIQELDQRFFSLETAPGDAKIFSCSNTSEQVRYTSESIIVRFYPVALEINLLDTRLNRFFVKPMLLVVVAWK